MDDLTRYPRIHVVGAAGAGMSGVARILAGLGHQVTASDLAGGPALDGLAAAGIPTWVGHRPGRAADWDLVVASSAVPDGDPELAAARTAAVDVWRRPRLLAALTAGRPAIGLAGTHGKTTTTAMAICGLRAAGHDPTFVVGGELIDLGTGAHLGDPGLFVLEADEAFRTFLSLHLRAMLVTSVEPDHLESYDQSFAQLEAAFADVGRRTAGPVLACADDAGARRFAAEVGAITFGTAADADWRVRDVRPDGWAVEFRLDGPPGELKMRLPRPGAHMARDAAGVVALLAECGYDPVAVAAGLEGFAGVRRRSEVRGDAAGVTVVDDYAHHPTEIAAMLDAARGGSWSRVWAVFQPHLYSRTEQFAGDLGAALAPADRVVVTDVYGAREEPKPGVTGELVADAAEAAGARVDYVAARGDLAPFLAGEVAPGDLVLMLGAGDITVEAGRLAATLGGDPS